MQFDGPLLQSIYVLNDEFSDMFPAALDAMGVEWYCKWHDRVCRPSYPPFYASVDACVDALATKPFVATDDAPCSTRLRTVYMHGSVLGVRYNGATCSLDPFMCACHSVVNGEWMVRDWWRIPFI